MKMALARALHHSAQPAGPVVEEPEEEVEFEEHAGLRAQNTPPPGSWPGVLKDPGPPWVEAVTVGYVAAGAPSLVVAPVAAHDELDNATVQFLLQQSLLARAQEEEEARELEEVMLLEEKVKEKERRIVEEIDRLRGLGENDRSPLLIRTCAWYVARRDLLAKMEETKRKRKKRSKKKLPKSSSTRFSRGVRGRRCGQGFRSRSSSSGARGCSLPRSPSTPTVRRVLRRQLHLLPVQVDWQGSQRAVGVFLYCDKTIKVDRDALKCCQGCSSLPLVVSASVRCPTLTRSSSSTGCVCHPSVAASGCRVVVDFYSWWCLRFGLGHGEAVDWKYFVNYFQYHEFVGCICMLNSWFSSNVQFCADNYIYFLFTLQACVAVSSGRCICTVIPGSS